MASNKTLLVVGIGAAALYLLSQRQAVARQAAYWPTGAMNPNGFPQPAEWWQQPAAELLENLVYYPFNAYPSGSPTPQSASQMGWPTSTYA